MSEARGRNTDAAAAWNSMSRIRRYLLIRRIRTYDSRISSSERMLNGSSDLYLATRSYQELWDAGERSLCTLLLYIHCDGLFDTNGIRNDLPTPQEE